MSKGGGVGFAPEKIKPIFTNNKTWDEWIESACDSAGRGVDTHRLMMCRDQGQQGIVSLNTHIFQYIDGSDEQPEFSRMNFESEWPNFNSKNNSTKHQPNWKNLG